MTTEPPGEPTPGFFGSLKRLLQGVLAIAQNRLELLLVEAQEERARLFQLLLLAGLVIGLGLLTLAVVICTLVVLCAKSQRFDLLAGLILVCLFATVLGYWRLRSKLKAWRPFPATLAELKKDKACLDKKN